MSQLTKELNLSRDRHSVYLSKVIEAASLVVGPWPDHCICSLYKLAVTYRYRTRDVNVVIDRIAIGQWQFAYWLQDVGFIEGNKPMLGLSAEVQMMLLHLLETIEGQK